jgi:hypothetical protein
LLFAHAPYFNTPILLCPECGCSDAYTPFLTGGTEFTGSSALTRIDFYRR